MLAFTEIQAAVKKRERTDQYNILGALYCLGAFEKPVTTKEIKDLLALHPTIRLPTNLSARLAAYHADVDPTDKGPPRKWRLTPRGLAKLREISGLALQSEAAQDSFGIDVGIVCALEQPEMVAVVQALGGPARWTNIGNPKFPHLYNETEVATTAGSRLKVVATTATSMGLTAAAIATMNLVHQYRPRLVVMPGIAAGTRSGNKQYGDVLVADPSVDYNSGKVVETNGIREFLPDPYPIGLHPRLRTILQKYRGDHSCFSSIRQRWKFGHPEKPNRLHVGPVGAADQVIDDPSRVIEITKNWRKLIGVEMETYGVYRACLEAPEPKPRFVSFKAVCDFAEQKADSWQLYAAFVAAEFTRYFLVNDWDQLWHSPGKATS